MLHLLLHGHGLLEIRRVLTDLFVVKEGFGRGAEV